MKAKCAFCERKSIYNIDLKMCDNCWEAFIRLNSMPTKVIVKLVSKVLEKEERWLT